MRRFVLLSGVSPLVALVMSPTAALGQTLPAADAPAAASSEADAGEDIVVTGIRASVQRSLDIKRQSEGVVDAISSEDIGKFPDQNVAEALQRVTGVSISRARGEGTTITIRGLGGGFARTTVNGRDLVSGASNRSFNFNVLASEYVSALEVYKTAQPDMIEGGIGGIVNIRTARPLDFREDRIGLTVKGDYSDLEERIEPNASAIISKRFADNTLGVLLTANYSKRALREDQFQASTGYRRTTFTRTDGTRFVDAATPTSLDFHAIDTVRERTGVSGAVQWKPSPQFELVVDGLYTRLDTDESQASLFSQVSMQRSAVQVNSVEVDQNNTVTYLDATWQTRLMDRRFNDVDDAFVLGANARFGGDSWRMTVDASYSKGKNAQDGGQAILQPVVRTIYDDRAGSVVPDLLYPGGIDSDRFGFRNFFLFNSAYDSSNWAVSADVEKDLGGSFFKLIKAGVRYSSRENNGQDASLPYFPYGNAAGGWPAIGANKRRFPVDNFFSSLEGDFPRSWALPDYETYYELTNAGAQKLTDNLPGRFTITERTYAGYGQIKFDTDLGSVRMQGDVGVRVVKTEQSSDGYGVGGVKFDPNNGYAIPDALSPQSISRSYTDVLPSATLRFDLSQRVVLRFAAAKVLTRPNFADLSPRLTISGFDRVGASGNPNLEPFTANQVDASVEWYFAPAGAVTAGLFYKDMGSFISNVVSVITLPGDVPGGSFSITRPENGDGATIKGAEIGFQQSLTFLPQPLDGLGVIANYTYVDSNASFSNQVSGLTYSLEGLAKHTVNLTGYYERGPFSARFTYNYRSNFLFQAIASENNTSITAGYGQLDGSIAFDVTPNISLSIEGLNLTNEPTRRYYDIPERTNLYSVTGRRILAGVRVRL